MKELTMPSLPSDRILFLVNALPSNYFLKDWESLEKEIQKLVQSNPFNGEWTAKEWDTFVASVKIVAKALWLQVPHPQRKNQKHV